VLRVSFARNGAGRRIKDEPLVEGRRGFRAEIFEKDNECPKVIYNSDMVKLAKLSARNIPQEKVRMGVEVHFSDVLNPIDEQRFVRILDVELARQRKD
jgi:hypothetical protein